MPGCAFGPCDRSTAAGGPGCYLCDVVAALPQGRPVRDAIRLTDKATRDGVAELKRIDPTFTKRRRVGPHR